MTSFKQWKSRVTNLDRLSYAMVIVFGICLLVVMLFFQFGYQLGEIHIEPFLAQEEISQEQTAKLLLIDEPNPVIRGIEIIIALGLIALGSERLHSYSKRK